jgi:hypothetical protein
VPQSPTVMKQKLFYILLFFCVKFFAQAAYYKLLIDGIVFDLKTKSPSPNTKITLVCNDGSAAESITDNKGYYYFKFASVSFKTGTISIDPAKYTTEAKPSSCYGSDGRTGYFYFKEDEAPKHIVKDFEIPEEVKMTRFPSLRFKRNSLVFDTIKEEFQSFQDSDFCFPQHTIRMLTKTLNENPTIIIQVSAHCSAEEKDQMTLSQKRAQKVADELIKHGISKERIITKGFGATKLLVKTSEIKLAQTKEEMMILSSKNRRCTFGIVSWDYGVGPVPNKVEKDE